MLTQDRPVCFCIAQVHGRPSGRWTTEPLSLYPAKSRRTEGEGFEPPRLAPVGLASPCNQPLCQPSKRTVRDSNPRCARHACFRDRSDKPDSANRPQSKDRGWIRTSEHGVCNPSQWTTVAPDRQSSKGGTRTPESPEGRHVYSVEALPLDQPWNAPLWIRTRNTPILNRMTLPFGLRARMNLGGFEPPTTPV